MENPLISLSGCLKNAEIEELRLRTPRPVGLKPSERSA